ncbi:MAG TPA: hypothetical protein DDW52_30440 [Planctomycetaceae bacterium]|nr:hypothetical protein [Planctomycetaceae bacterium]
MSHVTTLFRSLQTVINGEIAPLEVVRRYMPLKDGTELDELQISLYLDTSDQEILGRGAVIRDLVTFGIAIQKNIPGNRDTDDNGDPVLQGNDDRSACDEVLDIAEQLKDLWRCAKDGTEGPLFAQSIEGFTFTEMNQDFLYEPLHMALQGVFSSVFEVTYARGS